MRVKFVLERTEREKDEFDIKSNTKMGKSLGFGRYLRFFTTNYNFKSNNIIDSNCFMLFEYLDLPS